MVKTLNNYNDIASDITVKLINKKNAQPNALIIPVIDNIVATFSVMIGKLENDTIASILVTEDVANSWGKTALEIYNQAVYNMEQRMDYDLKTMGETIAEMTGMPAEFFPCSGIWVLTNGNKMYGAACILSPKVMEIVRGEVGTNFYIVPSSVHEVLITFIEDMDSSDMNGIINDVNTEVVADEEILSDHVYRYDYDRHILINS